MPSSGPAHVEERRGLSPIAVDCPPAIRGLESSRPYLCVPPSPASEPFRDRRGGMSAAAGRPWPRQWSSGPCQPRPRRQSRSRLSAGRRRTRSPSAPCGSTRLWISTAVSTKPSTARWRRSPISSSRSQTRGSPPRRKPKRGSCSTARISISPLAAGTAIPSVKSPTSCAATTAISSAPRTSRS